MTINAMKKLGFALAVVLGAATLGAATKHPVRKPAAKAAAKAPTKAPARDWSKAITYLPSGSVVKGNPAAKVKLVEFISYTCPHCAHFNAEGSPILSKSYAARGKVQIEVRPFFRNVFDVPASLLAHCGPVDRFFGNHDAILAAQDTWLEVAMHPTNAMRQRWSTPDFGQRMKAISDDLGLTRLMIGRGYTDAQLTACLADRPLADSMAELTQEAGNVYKVEGTPSFLINNTLQADVYDWPALKPALDKALK